MALQEMVGMTSGVDQAIAESKKAKEAAIGEELKAGQAVEKLKTDKQIFEAESKARSQEALVKSSEELEEKRREREKPLLADLDMVNEQMMKAQFAPSQESVKDQAALFSLISVLGFAIGAGGKKNAMQAMSAMNGMLEGHRQGRADLYAKERQTFDSNLKALKEKAVTLENELKRSLETHKTDKQLSREIADLAYAREGADFMRKYEQINGLVATYERAKELRKSAEAAYNKEVSRKERLQDFAERKAIAVAGRAEPSARYTPAGVDDKGNVVLIDTRTGESRVVEGVKPRQAAATGGAVQFRYNAAMVNAGNQLAIEIENMASLPITAMPPAAAEVLTDPSKGLTEAAEKYFAQGATSAEARAMQQITAGMVRAITTIEASGRPSGATEAAIKEFGKTVPKANDKKINLYLFLGQAKQVMDILVKDLQASGATEDQINQAKVARDGVNDVVTWSVKDINRIIGGGKRTLVDDQLQKSIKTSENLSKFGKDIKATPAAAAAPEQAAPTAPAAPAAAPSPVAKQKAQPGEQIYSDAQGNKAVKRNNQWVEVE